MDNFFGKNFEADAVCGMFTPGHFMMVAIFIVLATLTIYFFRNIPQRAFSFCMLGISILITTVEIVKIIYRSGHGQPPCDWVPLYYCSLFIFASWFCNFKNPMLRAVGCSFVTMGGILAAIIFIVYPSTSINIYPLWHFESWWSYLYHLLMFTSGIIMMTSGYYRPKKEHAVHYFVFIVLATIPSVVINILVEDVNCLFLKDAYELPILTQICEFSPFLYGLIAFIGQAVLMFWGNFAIYNGILKLIKKISAKRGNKSEASANTNAFSKTDAVESYASSDEQNDSEVLAQTIS